MQCPRSANPTGLYCWNPGVASAAGSHILGLREDARYNVEVGPWLFGNETKNRDFQQAGRRSTIRPHRARCSRTHHAPFPLRHAALAGGTPRLGCCVLWLRVSAACCYGASSAAPVPLRNPQRPEPFLSRERQERAPGTFCFRTSWQGSPWRICNQQGYAECV